MLYISPGSWKEGHVKFFAIVTLLGLSALPVVAQHDQYHLQDRLEYVDSRHEILTEQVLRNNEEYFFYLFNNGRPAPEHANVLLEQGGRSYWFTVAKFSDGNLWLGFTDQRNSLVFDPESFCLFAVRGTLMPFPVTKETWSKKRPKARLVSGKYHKFAFVPYRSRFLFSTRPSSVACVSAPAGVFLEYVHSYLITPEMRDVIRRWMWEKWGDTTRLATQGR